MSNLIASKKQFGKKIRNIDYFGACIFKNSAKFLHCPIPSRSLRITFDFIDPDKILIIANRWLDGYWFTFPVHLIPFTLSHSCACADPRVNEIEMKLQSLRSLVLKVKKKNQKSRSACNLHNSFPADIDRVFIKPMTFFSR